MKLININLKEDVVRQIDSVVSTFGFTNRSEFIRGVIQDKLEDYRVKQAIIELSKNKGRMTGRGFTDEEYEKARVEAFEELSRRIQ
ncbi:MAG: ribbon-helix-helix domain-containing protein [Candidatus Altiarchaeota archaeon]|nr:ribbon-helix-helix domain-containing protein [Candidatus Altiarchaeota archaeon]